VAVRTLLSARAGGSAGVPLLAILKLIVNGMLTDSHIPDNGLTTSKIEASNSSASTTITITMYTGDE